MESIKKLFKFILFLLIVCVFAAAVWSPVQRYMPGFINIAGNWIRAVFTHALNLIR